MPPAYSRDRRDVEARDRSRGVNMCVDFQTMAIKPGPRPPRGLGICSPGFPPVPDVQVCPVLCGETESPRSLELSKKLHSTYNQSLFDLSGEPVCPERGLDNGDVTDFPQEFRPMSFALRVPALSSALLETLSVLVISVWPGIRRWHLCAQDPRTRTS